MPWIWAQITAGSWQVSKGQDGKNQLRLDMFMSMKTIQKVTVRVTNNNDTRGQCNVSEPLSVWTSVCMCVRVCMFDRMLNGKWHWNVLRACWQCFCGYMAAVHFLKNHIVLFCFFLNLNTVHFYFCHPDVSANMLNLTVTICKDLLASIFNWLFNFCIYVLFGILVYKQRKLWQGSSYWHVPSCGLRDHRLCLRMRSHHAKHEAHGIIHLRQSCAAAVLLRASTRASTLWDVATKMNRNSGLVLCFWFVCHIMSTLYPPHVCKCQRSRSFNTDVASCVKKNKCSVCSGMTLLRRN